MDGTMTHHAVPDSNRRNARRMRKALTAAELRFWNTVRAHRLMGLGFRRQVPIAGYIGDFACPEHKLVIEIDGPSHTFDQSIERDKVRDLTLVSLGWTVLRFTNEDVLEHLDGVCTHFLQVIGVRRFE
jgi:very-short-patch-repair endonuclease